MKKGKFEIKNTLGMFDILKGVLMITMLFAHSYGLINALCTSAPGFLLVFLTGFIGDSAMPALLIMSGYGFRKTSVRKCFNKQVGSLLVPYVITMVVTLATHLVAYYLIYGGGIRYSIRETARLFISFILGATKECRVFGIGIGPCGPTWFLLSLFIGNIVFCMLLQKFEDKKLLFASFLVACVGWLLSKAPIMPFAISQGLVATFYVCVGYVIKRRKIFGKPIKTYKKVLIVFFAMFITTASKAIGGEFNMSHDDYFLGPLSIVIIGFLAVTVIYLSLYLNCFTGKISMFFRSLGRNSLYVFCIHAVEIVAIGRYLQYDYVNNYKGELIVCSSTVFATRLVVTILATYTFIWFKSNVIKKLSNKG